MCRAHFCTCGEGVCTYSVRVKTKPLRAKPVTGETNEADSAKVKRNRPPVQWTLSKEAIEMGKMLAEREGGVPSRMIERWIREAFDEYGMKLPEGMK
jgi:hypothetical protein